MMGSDSPDGNELGVIPRLCKGILTATSSSIQISRVIDTISSSGKLSSSRGKPAERVLSVELSLSYYEIYNEEVHDLLSQSPELSCRVRESKDEGALVENLTKRSFGDYDTVASFIREGNNRRILTATSMTSTSSRSHAVLTVYLSQQIIPMVASLDCSQSSSNCNSIVSRQSKVKLHLLVLFCCVCLSIYLSLSLYLSTCLSVLICGCLYACLPLYLLCISQYNTIVVVIHDSIV